MPSRKPIVYVDPSIKDCATALIVEAMDGINAKCRAGVSYWIARDATLEAVAGEWVRLYGKPCADAAVRGLHCLAPDEVLEADTKRVQRDRRVSQCRADLTTLDPTRDTWLNRAWISLTGYRLYGIALAVAVAGATFAAGGVSEAQAAPGAGNRDWRSLAVCGASLPGQTRDRACRKFNAAERSGFRGYDAPGGNPWAWELLRNYEVPN